MLAKSAEMPQFSYADFGQEVTGATLGIVGMGGIGKDVAHRAFHGFRMKVLYHNRNQRFVGYRMNKYYIGPQTNLSYVKQYDNRQPR